MLCPHCHTKFTADAETQHVHTQEDPDTSGVVEYVTCIECGGLLLDLVWQGYHGGEWLEVGREQLWPKSPRPPELPPEIPSRVAKDYIEGRLVLTLSPNAAAALARRCLQEVLRTVGGATQRDLFDQIEEVLAGGKLPSALADSLDAVRTIGNFAAHPIKSEQTGEVVDVEPGEAEWVLDTLEGLFDYYYVLPAKMIAKRDALNARLAEAGKPPLR